jgi:hypothetical protein
MKLDATLDDYQRREVFLKSYLEKQINKINTIGGDIKSQSKIKAYKDILFKLNKL